MTKKKSDQKSEKPFIKLFWTIVSIFALIFVFSLWQPWDKFNPETDVCLEWQADVAQYPQIGFDVVCTGHRQKTFCELCGGHHITAANKDGRVCSYCKVNRRQKAIECLRKVGA